MINWIPIILRWLAKMILLEDLVSSPSHPAPLVYPANWGWNVGAWFLWFNCAVPTMVLPRHLFPNHVHRLVTLSRRLCSHSIAHLYHHRNQCIIPSKPFFIWIISSHPNLTSGFALADTTSLTGSSHTHTPPQSMSRFTALCPQATAIIVLTLAAQQGHMLLNLEISAM